MKIVKQYSISVLLLIVLLTFLAGIMTIFRFNSQANEKTIEVVSLIVSGLLFMLCGLLIGHLRGQKGYLNGIVCIVVYSVFTFLFSRFNLDVSYLNFGIRSICLFTGCIIGVNI